MSDDEDSNDLEWILGFVQKPPHPWSLMRHKFPSKVGGRPAWLDPVQLPREDQLQSKSSQDSLSFLLQVYCPVDGNDEAFHRTIFLFVPSQGNKMQEAGNVRALRCQLPRENSYYESHPSKDDFPRVQKQESDKTCSHDPWNVVETEVRLAKAENPPNCERILFPEHQLVTDYEEAPSIHLERHRDNGNAEDQIQDSDVGPDIESAISSVTNEEQKHFADFAARISWDPEQVLRYCFEDKAEPLWPNPKPIPKPGEIPPCPICSGPRKFEFEILPQLLNWLELDNEKIDCLDWGAIAVYSCAKSCTSKDAYVEEFVFVQPP